MALIKFKETVKELLLKYPEYRDSDEKLIAHIWKYYMIDKTNKPYSLISAEELLQMFSKNMLPNIESIGRVRRKLQQENIELRGLFYLDRKKTKTKEVKKEIKENNWKL